MIEINQDLSFEQVYNSADAELIWDHQDDNSLPINLEFYAGLQKEGHSYLHKHHFSMSLGILNKKGIKDCCATIFYMVNCLQELTISDEEYDQIGRFKFKSSYQFKYECVDKNLVQEEIFGFCLEHNIPYKNKKSKIFVSHDIDTLYGSFLQDGFWALKKKRLDIVLKIIINEFIRTPHWRNIDKIINLSDEHSIKSTFFWLVNSKNSTSGIKNADYSFRNENKLINLILDREHNNALHKSCSDFEIDEEIRKSGYGWNINRYHYLNFLTTTDWPKLSNSKIKLDCSLGFAESYGFRNSYGKAFQPFNIKENKPFDFIELPLNVMDTTLHKYMKIPTEKVANTIINFFEKNKYNCDLTLLWHNTYITNYKYHGFLEQYKKVLLYHYENNIESINPKQIIDINQMKW